MKHEAIETVAQRYRDEGYDVIMAPRGDQVPAFGAGFEPDLIARRGNEGVIVEVLTNRRELASRPEVTRWAEIVDTQPGWGLDVIVLEPETDLDKAARKAAEPSNEQLAQTLKAAEDLAETGYTPYACVVAWGGLEAAMRRRFGGLRKLPGRMSPNELMSTLYSNGLLNREQFDRLRDSYLVRTQVVHGLVPSPVDRESIRYLTDTARSLMDGEEAPGPSLP